MASRCYCVSLAAGSVAMAAGPDMGAKSIGVGVI